MVFSLWSFQEHCFKIYMHFLFLFVWCYAVFAHMKQPRKSVGKQLPQCLSNLSMSWVNVTIISAAFLFSFLYLLSAEREDISFCSY